MIGLLTAIIVFNAFVFWKNSRLSKNQIIHIWTFTIALQTVADLYTSFKYHAYWYFNGEIDWKILPVMLVLIPPVNIIFLNWYPFKQVLFKQIFYILCWSIAITFYEWIALLPEPWGYFHYGWWKIEYTLAIDPFLFLIVAEYYNWIKKF
ncbi:MAG: hypothetical protein ACE3JK_10280 [Sporolactobacillus sp.]